MSKNNKITITNTFSLVIWQTWCRSQRQRPWKPHETEERCYCSAGCSLLSRYSCDRQPTGVGIVIFVIAFDAIAVSHKRVNINSSVLLFGLYTCGWIPCSHVSSHACMLFWPGPTLVLDQCHATL